jgi:hypothetical protein
MKSREQDIESFIRKVNVFILRQDYIFELAKTGECLAKVRLTCIHNL